jgi:cyclopropane fatty-acyl-phospholipid synthase-like methyltransferase
MYKECTWDERYKAGKEALPWDSGVQAPELELYFSSLEKPPESVLEIGCGTGTNAIWMAQKGCRVVATDLSPSAIDAAMGKQEAAGTAVDFQVSDIIAQNPVAPGSVDFVFDRGVYHVMTPELRRIFIERVSEALTDGGFWLCLAGNADEHRGPDEPGPPQLKLSELVDDAEKHFEIHRVDRASFVLPDGSPKLAWIVLYRKRNQVG